MRKTQITLGAALLTTCAGLLFAIFSRSAVSAVAPPPKVRGNCGMCHKAIAEQWINSLHSQAFKDANFIAESKDVKDKESKCYVCHAPQAVRVNGLGKTPGFRTDLQEIGVDCQVCHMDLKGTIHAPFKGSPPHAVEVDPQHRTEILCASCHTSFGTLAEFKTSSEAKDGKTCADCHMPKAMMPGPMGGKPMMTASHEWKLGGDPDTLKKAISLTETVSPDGALTVQVGNVGAAHKFPTGQHVHQGVLVVTVTDDSGKSLFSSKTVFANDTLTGGKDTRIDAGETRVVTLATGVKAGVFKSDMYFKQTPAVDLKDAVLITSATAKL